MSEKKCDINSEYKVKLEKDFSLDFIYFSNFYLPIIESKAYSLYLFLFSETQNNFSNSFFISQKRLIDFLNMEESTIEKSIKYLEFLNLIEVYKKEDDSKYIYVIKKPLELKQFDKNIKFKELLISKIGNDNYNLNFRNSLRKIYKDNDNFKLLSTKYQFEDNKVIIENVSTKLDFIPLFNVFNEAKINYHKFWTKEIEETIKDMIILYKLSILDVLNIFKYMNKEKIKITKKNIYQIVKDKFNFEILNLDKVIENEKINLSNKDKILKNTKSIDFLNLIIKRTATSKEVELVKNLKEKYKFDNYIINILLDYSNIVNGGFIIPNYIYKISDTLLKMKINKGEDVIQYLKTSYKIKKQNKKTEEVSLKKLNLSTDVEVNNDLVEKFGELKWKRK